MRVVRKIGAAFALCALSLSASSHAADCDSNFSSAGNFLSGQQFKTSAQLANVAPDSAFAAVQRHLASQGWAIQHADRTAGVLTAWHAGSRAERPIPLSVTVEDAPGGSKLSLSFSTPGGAFSPAGSVKEEFCKVAAAALAAPAAPAALQTAAANARVGAVPAGAADISRKAVPTPVVPGQICLGKACLGMTLEEAGALPLEDFAYSNFKASDNGDCLTCGGAYGINAKGQRIWYSIFGNVDKKWI